MLLLSYISVWPGPTTPISPKRHRFGLFPFRSPLLRKSIFLSFPTGTKMFQFPAFAHLTMYMAFSHMGCPIRTPADQVFFADTRGFSQLRASFIADGSLGILRMLFSNFLYVFSELFLIRSGCETVVPYRTGLVRPFSISDYLFFLTSCCLSLMMSMNVCFLFVTNTAVAVRLKAL